jgi:hypothetical protein
MGSGNGSEAADNSQSGVMSYSSLSSSHIAFLVQLGWDLLGYMHAWYEARGVTRRGNFKSSPYYITGTVEREFQ